AVLGALPSEPGVPVPDDLADAKHQIVHRDRLARLLEIGHLRETSEIDDGPAQGLGRDGAMVQAGPSQDTQSIDDDDLLAYPGALERARQPGGAGPDHREIDRCPFNARPMCRGVSAIPDAPEYMRWCRARPKRLGSVAGSIDAARVGGRTNDRRDGRAAVPSIQ